MENYVDSKHCCKCLCDRIGDTFLEKQEPPGQFPERIRRECKGCGYSWMAKPADAE